MQLSTARSLDRLASVAVVVMAALVISTWLGAFATRGRTMTPVARTSELHRGLKVHIIGLDPSKSRKTVILALGTHCRYCRESLPFYRELMNISSEKASTIQMIAVFQEPEHEIQAFVREASLRGVSTVASTSLAALKVPGTPAILLLDNNGTLIDFAVGKLSKAGE